MGQSFLQTLVADLTAYEIELRALLRGSVLIKGGVMAPSLERALQLLAAVERSHYKLHLAGGSCQRLSRRWACLEQLTGEVEQLMTVTEIALDQAELREAFRPQFSPRPEHRPN